MGGEVGERRCPQGSPAIESDDDFISPQRRRSRWELASAITFAYLLWLPHSRTRSLLHRRFFAGFLFRTLRVREKVLSTLSHRRSGFQQVLMASVY